MLMLYDQKSKARITYEFVPIIKKENWLCVKATCQLQGYFNGISNPNRPGGQWGFIVPGDFETCLTISFTNFSRFQVRLEPRNIYRPLSLVERFLGDLMLAIIVDQASMCSLFTIFLYGGGLPNLLSGLANVFKR